MAAGAAIAQNSISLSRCKVPSRNARRRPLRWQVRAWVNGVWDGGWIWRGITRL
jgi:hypothetical protein